MKRFFLTLFFLPGLLAHAQDSYESLEQPLSPVLQWSFLLLGLATVWFLCYELLYPKLLRHFSDAGHCKGVFWWYLAMLAHLWVTLSAFTLFEFGFHNIWFTYISIFFALVWSLAWLFLVVLHKEPA